MNFKKIYIYLSVSLLALLVGTLVILKPRIKSYFRRIESIENHKFAFDFPAENNGWKKFGEGPIYGFGDNTMFDPYCFIEDSVINMIVSDRAKGSLASVKSTDGVNFTNYKLILSGVPDTWENIVNRGCIVKCDSTYKLYYTGQNNDKSCIGVAISRDGINYNRISSNPIIIPEKEYEGVSVMNPCVIYDAEQNCFKIWYSAGETFEPNVICYAESEDGIKWEKRENPVLEKGHNEWEKDRVGGCQVIKHQGKYLIYYIGYQNIDIARICYGESDDGIHWKRHKNNLILSPSKNRWDSCAVYKPTIINWGNKIHLYYNGRSRGGEYIGLATQRIVN